MIRRPMPVGRTIDGISAVLLPFDRGGQPDWAAFERLIDRTYAAGLTPAVNMDTGHVNHLTVAERSRALTIASEVSRGRRFVGGAYIEDQTGDAVALYRAAVEAIVSGGGTPILFQSTALTRLDGTAVVDVYRRVAEAAPSMLAFE